MKKKLLLSTHTLNIGGVERSFIGLLENLDYSKYEVDVFLYEHHGELFDSLPNQVNLLPEIPVYSLLLKPIQESVYTMKFGIAGAKILGNILGKVRAFTLGRDSQKVDSIIHPWLYKIADYFLPPISKKQYDLCLAFLHPNFFEFSKVRAHKYAAWIHTDYSFLNIDASLELKMWSKYDTVFAVSDASKHAFVDIFPSLKSKVGVFENILSPISILRQAELKEANEIVNARAQVKLLSIGRFSYAKNFDNIPFIAQELRDLGLNFQWFILGYGSSEEKRKVLKNISDLGLGSHIFILGKKENPYPYIKACDFYVQPSRYEGKSVTVREAQILMKPVIITNYASASSQIRSGVDGFIVPLENTQCAEGIFAIATHKNVIEKVRMNLKHMDFSNVTELSKLDDILANDV